MVSVGFPLNDGCDDAGITEFFEEIVKCLANSLTIQIVSDQKVNSITFDSFGRSADYEIQITTNTRSTNWQVSGLTGFIKDGKAKQ